jgi:hypothetical protein
MMNPPLLIFYHFITLAEKLNKVKLEIQETESWRKSIFLPGKLKICYGRCSKFLKSTFFHGSYKHNKRQGFTLP